MGMGTGGEWTQHTLESHGNGNESKSWEWAERECELKHVGMGEWEC